MKLFNLFFITTPIKPSFPHLKTYSFKCSSETTTSTTSTTTHRLNLAESLQNETLKILEWPSVCNQVSAFTSTSMGFSAARDGLVPVGRSPEESTRLLNQTSAAFALQFPPDFSGIEDVSELLESSVAGQLLSIREICAVKRTLRSARDLFRQLKKSSLQAERIAIF